MWLYNEKIVLFLFMWRWGRGHPEQYTEAIGNLGDERFDSLDSDKKPRAGQILWIRGLTRLQTQVNLRYNIKYLQIYSIPYFYFKTTNSFSLYFLVLTSLNFKEKKRYIHIYIYANLVGTNSDILPFSMKKKSKSFSTYWMLFYKWCIIAMNCMQIK